MQRFEIKRLLSPQVKMPESIFEIKKYSDKTVRHVNGDINLLENF